MINRSEPANMEPSRFVDSSSRYINSTVIYYTSNGVKRLSFETYKKNDSYTKSNNDLYTVVSPGHEYRPDLLSAKIYGTPNYWWRILEANNIKDIFDFKSGLNIRIPQSIA